MSHVLKMAKGPLGPALVLMVSLVIILVVWLRDDASPEAPPELTPGIARIQSLERVESHSAQDWTRTADVVAIGTIVDEKRVKSATSETAIEGDSDLIGRTVTVSVEDVVWNAPTSKVKLADRIEMNVAGWATDGENIREAVFGDGPRLEVGHTYVLALVALDAECDETGIATAAGWSPIGSGGALPADDDVIGKGEFLGAVSGRPNLDGLPSDSLIEDLVGKPSRAIASALKEDPAQKRIDFQAGVVKC